MTGTTMSSWEEANMHCIFDGVLIRSAVEFRRALKVLRCYDAADGSEYVEHMREGLRAIEAELARRGIEVDGLRGRAEKARRVLQAEASAEQARPNERLPVPPPRSWPLHKKA